MDRAALYQVAHGSALRALSRKRHYLDLIAARADADDLLAARLIDGQFNLAEQLRTVTIFALRTVLPLAGQDWSLSEPGLSIDALRAQTVGAARDLQAVTAADCTSDQISHKAGEALLTQTPADYVTLFALPNLWFHLTTAHSILRVRGVDVGKADFDGLHGYPPGFSFV